ncbi:DUF6891 domain-containing protein [Tsukamurella strandjordii]|uniref:DUF6891 domain-containing protein n=1 Tax=Tsukamurella TaxID=2060 RepID=UPI001C7CAF95|nr:hypothetical protein [Tsukamurella sp. TY48]GIZ95635.1 hypothetical protein TTY48_02470 [Tsukamurella sp. TY48]
MANRFAQQNQVVPEMLRFGTLVRILPEDRLRAASMLVYPGYLTAEHAAGVMEAAGMEPQDARDIVQTAREKYQAHLDRSDGPGDWVRFDAACEAIAAHGLVVRQNFTCCRTCADEEIGDERTGDEWGYVYFTQQDAVELAYGKAGVYLGYGSFGPSPSIDPDELERSRGDARKMSAYYERTFDDLAAAITSALEAQGLRYDWDGDTGNRIKVIDMDWRRPLPEDGPVFEGVPPPETDAANEPESEPEPKPEPEPEPKRPRRFGFRF